MSHGCSHCLCHETAVYSCIWPWYSWPEGHPRTSLGPACCISTLELGITIKWLHAGRAPFPPPISRPGVFARLLHSALQVHGQQRSRETQSGRAMTKLVYTVARVRWGATTQVQCHQGQQAVECPQPQRKSGSLQNPHKCIPSACKDITTMCLVYNRVEFHAVMFHAANPKSMAAGTACPRLAQTPNQETKMQQGPRCLPCVRTAMCLGRRCRHGTPAMLQLLPCLRHCVAGRCLLWDPAAKPLQLSLARHKLALASLQLRRQRLDLHPGMGIEEEGRGTSLKMELKILMGQPSRDSSLPFVTQEPKRHSQ